MHLFYFNPIARVVAVFRSVLWSYATLAVVHRYRCLCVCVSVSVCLCLRVCVSQITRGISQAGKRTFYILLV